MLSIYFSLWTIFDYNYFFYLYYLTFYLLSCSDLLSDENSALSYLKDDFYCS